MHPGRGWPRGAGPVHLLLSRDGQQGGQAGSRRWGRGGWRGGVAEPALPSASGQRVGVGLLFRFCCAESHRGPGSGGALRLVRHSCLGRATHRAGAPADATPLQRCRVVTTAPPLPPARCRPAPLQGRDRVHDLPADQCPGLRAPRRLPEVPRPPWLFAWGLVGWRLGAPACWWSGGRCWSGLPQLLMCLPSGATWTTAHLVLRT